jgi:hypothetical protein
MYETIYNTPGSQGEMMEGNTINESNGLDMEKKFIDATVHHVIDALDVGYNDRRIVSPLLKKQLDNKLNHRYKGEGLLQQYGAYVLELAMESVLKNLDIPEDVKINHDHAGHAKLWDIRDYLVAKDKEEWLKKFRTEKK